MGGATRTLKWVLSTVDQGTGKMMGDLATKSEASSHRIGSAFSKVGGLIGGEVGDAFDKLAEATDKFDEHGMSAKLTAIGGAAMGVGGVLTAMGASEQQSSQQLDQAITNTGHSAEQFQTQIEDTVSHMEKYGSSAVDTKTALQSLTNATHDPQKAINSMGEAANLAASKHESLTSAADQLAKVLAGKGARTLSAYGVELVKNKDGTTNWDKTNQQLAHTLSGQADAAANTFTGRLKALRTEVEDNVAEFGQKYGPAILATGTVLTAVGPVFKGAASLVGKMAGAFKTSGAAATVAADETAAADAEIVASNEAAAASSEGLASASESSKGSMMAGVGVLAAVAAGAYFGGKALAKFADSGNAVGNSLTQTLNPSLDELTGKLEDAGNSAHDAAIAWAKGQIESSGLASRAAQAGISVDQMAAAVVNGTGATDKLIGQWQKSGKPSGDTITSLYIMAARYAGTAAAVKKTTESEKTHITTLDVQAKKLGTTTTALTAAKAAADKTAASNKANTLQMVLENDAAGLLTAALDKLNGGTLDVEQANIAAKNAIHAAGDSIKQNGSSLNDNTNKGRANVSMVLDAITAAQQHAEAVGKSTGSTQQATAAYQGDIAALRHHLIAVGYDKDAVGRLIGEYGRIPHSKLTKVDLQDNASARAAHVKGLLDSLTSGTYTAQLNVNGAITFHDSSGHQYPVKAQLAEGSDYASGGATMLAEREPEIIDLPRGSRVTPLSRLRYGAAGGDTHVHIYLGDHVYVTRAEVGRAIGEALEAATLQGMSFRIGVRTR